MHSKKQIKVVVLANLVVLGLLIVVWIGITTIQLMYPLNNVITDDRVPKFEWSSLKENYQLLIDDNPDFTSPEVVSVKGNQYIPEEKLDFGTYWWKVKSEDIESQVRKFTIVSTVALTRMKQLLKNAGNTELLVHRSGGLTGAVVLGVNQSIEIEENEDVKAEQK